MRDQRIPDQPDGDSREDTMVPIGWDAYPEARIAVYITVGVLAFITVLSALSFFSAVNLVLVVIGAYAIIGEQRNRAQQENSPPAVETIPEEKRQ